MARLESVLVNRRRALFLAAALVLLCFSPTIALRVGPGTLRTNAQFTPSLSSSIFIGYSPTTMNSLAQGVPVFSQGDQLWIETLNASSFSLNTPDGSTRMLSRPVEPNTIFLLYSFVSFDPEGNWSLGISTSMGSFSVPLQVVSQSGHSIGVSLSSYSMQNGELNLGFTAPPSDSYNIEGCLVPQTMQNSIQENIPGALGSGTLSFTFNGANSIISVRGTLAQSFTVWSELYYTYSYSNLNATQLVSRPQLVARSDPEVVAAPGNLSTSLNQEAILRDGRYTLRTFFDSAQGPSVQETRVLLFNSTWFWLSSCNPFAITGGSTFQKSVNIAGPVTQWPSGLFSMSDFRGVEVVDFLPLSVQIARIALIGNMSNVTSSNLVSDLGFSVLPNKAIQASSFYGGAIYVAASGFPLQVSILPTFGNEQFPIINETIASPFSNYSISIPVGEIEVHVSLDGSPASDSDVQLSNGAGGTTEVSTGIDGNATFYIPEGMYSLTARIGNSTQQQNFTVLDDISSSVEFEFKSVPSPADYTNDLLVAIVIGAAINIYAWIVLPRQRRYVVK